jgi:hypothetical protein
VCVQGRLGRAQPQRGDAWKGSRSLQPPPPPILAAASLLTLSIRSCLSLSLPPSTFPLSAQPPHTHLSLHPPAVEGLQRGEERNEGGVVGREELREGVGVNGVVARVCHGECQGSRGV